MIRELAWSHTEEAIDALVGIMQDPRAVAIARVRAAEALLDRAWGRPVQPPSGDEEGPALRIIIPGLIPGGGE